MKTFSQSVLAVILGGGAGTRLFPLTASRSKPAVPIAGKYRLVDIPISNCINSGINRMFVLTQFNSASLNKHIKNTYHFSAFSTGFVDILAAEQTPDNPGWFQGTADAVRQSLRHISNLEYDYILILSGDQLYQMDFGDMLKNHISSQTDISIATIPVDDRDAPEFGILKTNEENVITSFIEKPKKDILPDWVSDTGADMQGQGRNYLASMGIYIFNKKILDKLLNEAHPTATDFGKEIIPDSIENYKVSSFQYDGYWTDIGNIYSFYEANLALTQEVPLFNLFDNNKTVYSRARMLPPAKISGTTLEKTIIAEGSIIHASRIEQSVVGIRSRIGHGTTVVSTYIMGNDYYETLEEMELNTSKGLPKIGIGERCYIKDAIIDKNCRIGNDVRINGGSHLANTDHPLYTVKDGIVVVKKTAILPDGFVI
ncbi:MAG TPA: glucose-1-phosphate adenylyltransferase [Sediminibacterium sp.]|jgi:glucose-1-phosphate adenylyltransferase|uniref:glucose-1-phosphate adenylyltransferase n=1 Tax=Sediminibacterium sp. TaxID=1917865 RepID=UPI0008D126ED|nr:glucose-1-phosphate adenylyltransferase [Sediminibacterium sp.]OHC84063.1 MAG: glucose-1-phosphate adenylyltransferase [Sphingobacteriia bacterium RIFOXYC2_FULL_35_18]OHC87891.1 MAG: glucose-1-phosphate adenylyltransferase [Sphingobacteriia bacterium RIFOXYD2_FULL_35_12]OYZ54405.1 MAG: glucose-1-phosphate adenylyltransferase [Sphingobacteriia bacterium 24-36-13]OZA65180.1 MAG: glucose-1-phosphate adenylyltransferase [Sphingobacteriia bacterium 39-36-14]MBT9485293.1 glucose-1-phosphate adeny